VPFTQALAQEWSMQSHLVFVCGRFEGIDQRAIDAWKMTEVCLGDAVLTGGDIPALAMMDAIVRLIPGVVGDPQSLAGESFQNGLLEYPQFTRPREWNACIIPEVLLSGNHENIIDWRQQQSEKITQERRPDLWEQYQRPKG
jgi:tRNA (guanine37-N1)-methyltransferase